jgi:uncharacterized membrane protein
MKVMLALIVAFLLVGCGDSSGSGGDSSNDSSLACDHFRNTARDIVDGLLTDAEMREKLKEIHDNAAIGTPEVQNAARGMLAAATAGDVGKLGREVGRMSRACAKAGS